MTISFVLAPIPKWYFADNAGRPLAGGTMEVKSSLNPALDKQVFQEPTGTVPYPEPITFSENGTAGPFYWRIDSTQPDDLYFLNVFDSSGNPIFNIQNYPIAGGGGGGGGGTTALPINNIIVNNSFINNIGVTSSNPIADNTFLSPSGHSNFEFPDIAFFHTGTLGALDTITFNQFTPFGLNPFGSDYVTPYYINYMCSNNPVAELTKGYRIPLCPFVSTMAGQTFSVKFRARCNSGANIINVRALQYFGTGGSPSPSVRTIDVPFNLTNVWTEYALFITLPVVGGKTPGDSQDDGTYLEISLPINQNTNIDIAKMACYPGTIVPMTDFETFEEIESKAETPRTGDVRISSNGFSNNNSMNRQAGWIPLNDGTIGNTLSNSTTRSKPDAWLLYQLLFDNTVAVDCPLFDSAGVPIAKAGTALSNWNANNRLKLPSTAGRALVDRSTGVNALGHAFGEETHVLTIAEMPSHNHPGSNFTTFVDAGVGSAQVNRRNTNLTIPASYPVNVASQGGGGAHNNIPPSVYYNMIIKL